ncbi:gluconokinase [uncultured Litoreibacter sp.]|uniref:gluconokinase n=1 Tax=uncultured Litoreibacter sp. TaxID=1392394 RepID=UPI0026286596|nr:gluconokinase [uncultured Litoreibacter sp.]
MSQRYVIMGVSGAGKSLVGRILAQRTGMHFIDGDDLHPHSNVAKMKRGEALCDDDRAPWLEAIGRTLRDDNTVVACSALKRKYRDRITQRATAPVTFLFLQGKRHTLIERTQSREGHFMPPSLLESQLRTLEPPAADELHLVADIENAPEEIVDILISKMAELSSPNSPAR